MSYVDHAHRHLPGGTDPLIVGLPPFVDMGDPDVIVTLGDDPVVYGGPGRWWMSYRGGPAGKEILREGDVVLGMISVGIDSDPGTTGVGTVLHGYDILCVPYSGVTYDFITGSGHTSIGGVLYTASVTFDNVGTGTRFAVLSPNVADPPVGGIYGFNHTRPDWPAAFANGDSIFFGQYMFRVAAP